MKAGNAKKKKKTFFLKLVCLLINLKCYNYLWADNPTSFKMKVVTLLMTETKSTLFTKNRPLSCMPTHMGHEHEG